MARVEAGRPVPWMAPVLYVAVLVGGLYYAAVGGEEAQRPARLAGFAGGLALLLALDLAERRRYRTRTPTGPAIALLAVRFALFAGVAAVDEAGLSRALFVLVPFAAYFAFGRRAALALGAACTLLLLGRLALSVDGWYADAESISDLLMFALGLALALSMAAVAVREQDARLRLAAYAAEVADLSAARERNRLAREIHDSLGHHLTAIAIQVEKAAAFRDRDRTAADRALEDARWSAERALEEVRGSVRALRGPEDAAEPFSLSAALADLVRHIDGERMAVSLDVAGEEAGHGRPALTALYRAAQEALTNAHRHAEAGRVAVSVSYEAGRARLVVADDGRGLPATTGPGYGLRAMRERVRQLGGDLDVESARGAGTTITVTLPR